MRTHPLLLAYIGALIPAFAMALGQPVWSRVDEAQHTDFIIQLSHGHYPLADRTLIDPETLRIMESTGVFRFESPGTYPPPDLSDVAPPPPNMSPRANAVWMSRHMWQLSYESQQPPGYYVAVLPMWVLADRLLGTMFAIYVLRVINALLTALLAPMALLIARRLVPGRLELAMTAALFASLVPGVALDDTRVSNDALAAAMAGLVIVMSVAWAGERWTWRRTVLLGLCVGSGVLVKVTLVALVPAVGAAVLWPAAGSKVSRRLLGGLVAVAIAAPIVAIWLGINLHLYGAPVPSTRTNRLITGLPLSFSPTLLLAAVAFFGFTYWTGEPLSSLPEAVPAAVLGSLIALIAVAGLARLWVARVRVVLAAPLVVSVLVVAGMSGLALLIPATNQFKFLGPGRYAYPAVPAIAALISLGLHAAIKSAGARRILTAGYGVLALALVAVFALPLASPTSSLRQPPAASRSMATDESAAVGGFSIRVDAVALDPADHAIWFHVAVTNSGSGEAEWSPTPSASSGAASASGDYSKSTSMPGDIDSGRTFTGWLFVGMDPALLKRGRAIRLRFSDVAVGDYTTVADVVIELNVDSLLGS